MTQRIKSLNFPLSVKPPAKPDVPPVLGICPLGQVQLDDYHFEHVVFEDSYKRPCVVGQSSVAEFIPVGSSALWIGLLNTTADGQKAGMHLDLEHVKALIATLQLWVDKCTIDPNYRTMTRRKL